MSDEIQAQPEQSDCEPAIRLINAENGRTITQITRADFRQLATLGAPEYIRYKLDLFAAYLDGKNDARGRRS
jgi:hypothetical protein